MADTSPIKVRPEQPGGMDVPDRDKLVYETIGPVGNEEDTGERLLPPPEEPLVTRRPPTMSGEDLPALALPPKALLDPSPAPRPPAGTEAADSGTSVDQAAGSGTEPTDQARDEAPAAEAATPEGEEAQAQDNAQEDVAAVTNDEEAAAEASPGAYRLQLASMRSAEAADAAWEALRARHEDLLDGLRLMVERADLGSNRGVFYRVQAGSLATRADAEDLCASLKERQVGCLVVQR